MLQYNYHYSIHQLYQHLFTNSTLLIHTLIILSVHLNLITLSVQSSININLLITIVNTADWPLIVMYWGPHLFTHLLHSSMRHVWCTVLCLRACSHWTKTQSENLTHRVMRIVQLNTGTLWCLALKGGSLRLKRAWLTMNLSKGQKVTSLINGFQSYQPKFTFTSAFRRCEFSFRFEWKALRLTKFVRDYFPP